MTLPKDATKQSGKKTAGNKSVRILWRIFLFSLIGFNLIIVLMNFGLLGYMPSMRELENPSSALSSEVLASDGTILGRYFIQDRSNSKYEEISPNVFNALLATEDARFYDHSGIDGIAVLRAIVFLGKEGGGSTITQQLAKNLFPRRNPNIFTMPFIKLKEWVLAVKLERNLTKNEIITLYLNTVPFGDNVYGIKNASLTFYNKTPDKLTVDEAAVLIGMLKGNTLYNPRRNPENGLKRRNVVLGQMVKYGFLATDEANKLKDKPIKLNYHKIDYHEGMAPYFRQEVEQDLKKLLKQIKKPDSDEGYDIYKDGLKIYTTIDTRMQRYAEQAVEQHMKNLQKQFFAQSGYNDGSIWQNEPYKSDLHNSLKQTDRYKSLKEENKNDADIMQELAKPVKMKVFTWNTPKHEHDTIMSPIDSMKYMKMFLQAGFMVMDPFTGDVKAWVGGIDHTFFQYDHVNEETRRQVGSTIKPLLYTLAIDNGFDPCGSVSTAPQSFPGFHPNPYDAGGSEYGSLPMKKALAKSINNAALYLLNQVGINAFVDFVHRCGIDAKIDAVPAAALGVSDISLYEMLWAYTMFPTLGMNTKPIFITKIEDKNGNLIKSFVPQQKEIINANTAYKMVKMMQGVIDHGTGIRMRGMGVQGDLAGKTGTTNKQADAWFIGYTPQLLAGSWVGCDDRLMRFRSQALGQGSAAALPIFAYFINKVHADKTLGIETNAKFTPPDGFQDCDFYDPTSLERSESLPYGSTHKRDSTNQEMEIEQVPAIPNEEWNN
ncbi:MAG: transglycosylase domain-containing protein [Bacteroidetes bacterium]|nr:transglycosylase domain-containing protein [Bacteroidota bacterium]MBS1777132.1 transglycosylase domain-containing protein [Bacteroidota bacterium]